MLTFARNGNDFTIIERTKMAKRLHYCGTEGVSRMGTPFRRLDKNI